MYTYTGIRKWLSILLMPGILFLFIHETAAQNVGIGTMTPAAKLHIVGSVDTTQLILDANSTQSNTNPLIKLRKSDGSELMWIHSDSPFNTFIGLNTGRVNNQASGGIHNTFIGSNAGYANTTGGQNTALGFNALRLNTDRGNLVAIGDSALFNNGVGVSQPWHAQSNTAIGSKSMYTNTTGYANTAIGLYALYSNMEGYENTAIGAYSLFSNTYASSNTAIGANAMYSNTTGGANTALGIYSLYSNTTGNLNVALGFHNLSSNTTANQNIALGAFALDAQSFTNGGTDWTSDNVAIGVEALYLNQPTSINNGIQNTAIGNQSLHDNTIGFQNVATGYNALTANTSGSENTAIGTKALLSQSYSPGFAWATDNVAIGFEALKSNQPVSTTTGVSNTAVGTFALTANTSGFDNTGSGTAALYSNTTGAANTATGRQSLFYTTTGSFNTASGFKALRNNVIGEYNTANGAFALHESNGTGNTGIGYYALYVNSTGTYNTALGYNANPSIGTLTNATVIGDFATVNASNKVRIGNSSVTVIEGQVAYSWPSDGRFKENIQEDVSGLDFIMKLKPVSYNFNRLKYAQFIHQFLTPDSEKELADASQGRSVGFIAQDVEKIIQQTGFTSFDAVHAPSNETDNYSMGYAEFVVPLVKAMQEQQKMIDELSKANQDLVHRIEVLESREQ